MIEPATTPADSSDDSDLNKLIFERISGVVRIFVASGSLQITGDECSLYNESTEHNQEPDFMYAQILKEILISIPLTDEGKSDMIDYLKRKNRGNTANLMRIEAFSKDCIQEKAIHWYTCDGFLYFPLNQALRDQDINYLLQTQYYIRLLHEQLTRLYNEQKQSFSNSLRIYRGLLMPNDDFESVRSKCTNDFLCVNSFLSTTTDVDTAMRFAREDPEKPNTTRVIFEIDVDVPNCQTAFANIETESLMSSEKEILFTMGSIFTIQSIDKDSDDLWRIHLQLTGMENTQLAALQHHLKRDVLLLTPTFQLARLMVQKGQYDEARRLYNKLIRDQDPLIFGNYQNRAAVYTNLARCYSATGEKDTAEVFLNKSVQTLQEGGGADDNDLLTTYNHLALLYKEKGDASVDSEEKTRLYNQALSKLEEARRIGKLLLGESVVTVQTLPVSLMHWRQLASTFYIFGFIYDDQQKFEDAFKMYDECLKIRRLVLPSTHPDLGALYNNMAQVYQSQWNLYMQNADPSKKYQHSCDTKLHFDRTIKYFNKAHEIKSVSLSSHHPDLALSYNNIAMAYYLSGQFEKAIESMQKALTIYSNPNNRSNCGEIIKRLEKWLADVEQQRRSLNASN